MRNRRKAFFVYLDELRASGINMYRTAPLLEEDFGLSRKEAQLTLIEWLAARNKERFRKAQ